MSVSALEFAYVDTERKEKGIKKGHCHDLQTLKTTLGGDGIGLVGAEGRMRIHH